MQTGKVSQLTVGDRSIQGDYLKVGKKPAFVNALWQITSEVSGPETAIVFDDISIDLAPADQGETSQ